MLAPPRGLAPPPTGNPVSVPDSVHFFFIFMEFLPNNRLLLPSGVGTPLPGKSFIRHQIRSKIEVMNLREVNTGGSRISPGWGAPTYYFAKISQKLHEIEISGEIGCPRWIRPFHRKLALGKRLLEMMLPPFLKQLVSFRCPWFSLVFVVRIAMNVRKIKIARLCKM